MYASYISKLFFVYIIVSIRTTVKMYVNNIQFSSFYILTNIKKKTINEKQFYYVLNKIPKFCNQYNINELHQLICDIIV